MSDAATSNQVARAGLSVGDRVVIDSPGSKRHGKQGEIVSFKTDQTLLLAYVMVDGEKRLFEAQPRWLKKIGGQA